VVVLQYVWTWYRYYFICICHRMADIFESSWKKNNGCRRNIAETSQKRQCKMIDNLFVITAEFLHCFNTYYPSFPVWAFSAYHTRTCSAFFYTYCKTSTTKTSIRTFKLMKRQVYAVINEHYLCWVRRIPNYVKVDR